MLASNETGVIQPVGEVVACARRCGALVHCDAVQAAGKIPIDLAALGVDLMTISAHKLGGPQGVGALVLGSGIEPVALQRGGAQERRWRPGTENLPGIVGFGRACELAAADTDWQGRVGGLRDRLEAGVAAMAPQARVLGRAAPRLANTSCLTMPGVDNRTQLIDLDLAGVAVSTGSACSSGKVGPSHVLAAMGVPDEEARTAIRVSLGWASTGDDVDRFLAAWRRLYAADARPGRLTGPACIPRGLCRHRGTRVAGDGRMAPQVLSLTPAAVGRVRQLLASRGDDTPGIRIGVRTAGCSGLTYTIDFVDEIKAGDEVIEAEDVKVVVDPAAVMYLVGTEMDFVQDKLGAAFKFTNPNEAGRCGCGESFTV